MSKNIVSASLVVLGLGLWMGSGALSGASEGTPEPDLRVESGAVAPAEARDSVAEGSAAEGSAAEKADLSRVRVAVIDSQLRTRDVALRGKTQSKRIVDVKAEITGNVVARPVERGDRVAQGDLLCEVAVDDRAVSLKEAQAAYETARIEHQGSLKLQKQGLLSDVAVATSEARRESAKANVHRQQLNLAKTRIVAPFAGVVETLHMNVGDYAMSGAACATLIDLDPMLVIAHVSEGEVDALTQGQDVVGRLSGGREVAGVVSFVGKQSDSTTRTYPVEVTVENSDYSIRSGLTVSLNVGVERVAAHKVSSSLLTLNDAGEIGLRTLDSANRVVFNAVEILEDGADGVWITGLPSPVSLITVGQEYVGLGERVEPVYEQNTAILEGQLAGL
ncbi:MAG: efflux RND transporter periplasmic adaptor subunit [Halioglobus sp.]